MKAAVQDDMVVLELRAEVAKLKAKVRRLEREEQARVLGPLLPAIAGRYGSDFWTVSEILSDPILREVAQAITPDRLGCLLTRAAGSQEFLRTYDIEKIGKDRRNKSLYRITYRSS